MAFPIVPKYRTGSAGNPTSLNLGEFASNTHTGAIYLGADVGVVQIGIPVAAGTVETTWTANGTANAFAPISGYNGTAIGGYLVTVQGMQQPFTVTADNGGTLVFDFTPPTGSVVRVRAITQAQSGGGGDATSIQGVAVSTTTASAGQVLAMNDAVSEWQPCDVISKVLSKIQFYNTQITFEQDIPGAPSDKWTEPGRFFVHDGFGQLKLQYLSGDLLQDQNYGALYPGRYKVTGLQGTPVGSITPNPYEVLTWNGFEWQSFAMAGFAEITNLTSKVNEIISWVNANGGSITPL